MKLGDVPISQLIDICRAHYCCDECPLLKDNVCMLYKLPAYKDMEVNINAETRGANNETR